MTREDWKRTFTHLGWIAAFFTLVAIVISAVERKQTLPVSELTIAIDPLPGGHFLITEKDVLTIINRGFGFRLEELQLGAVDVRRLERVLEEDPFIINADVFIDNKNRINTRIQQRLPALRVIDNNGLNYYLDAEGLRMPLSPNFTARVLAATGNIPPHTLDFLTMERPNKLRDLFQLAKIIREDPFYQAQFEQVHVNNRGEFVLAPKVGDHIIILGTIDQAERKLRNLKIFYHEGLPYEGWRKYETIDLRFDGQVVAKKR
jgi:cell division protein FtsQ